MTHNLTHNLTHNRKRAGGGNGAESTIVSDFLEQKCPQSAEWRRFEDGQSVGKDEVSSSNLDSRSTKSLEPQRFEGFLLFVSGGVISEFVTVLLPGRIVFSDGEQRNKKKKRI